jgi:hypothetical protein
VVAHPGSISFYIFCVGPPPPPPGGGGVFNRLLLCFAT